MRAGKFDDSASMVQRLHQKVAEDEARFGCVKLTSTLRGYRDISYPADRVFASPPSGAKQVKIRCYQDPGEPENVVRRCASAVPQRRFATVFQGGNVEAEAKLAPGSGDADTIRLATRPKAPKNTFSTGLKRIG